jgi:hypothetical protein
MTAAGKKMHNQISIMHFHSQNMQKFVFEKNDYAKLSTEVHPTMGLEQSRQSLDKGRMLVCPKAPGDDVLPFRFVDAPVHLFVVDVVSQYPRGSIGSDSVARQHHHSLFAKVIDK